MSAIHAVSPGNGVRAPDSRSWAYAPRSPLTSTCVPEMPAGHSDSPKVFARSIRLPVESW